MFLVSQAYQKFCLCNNSGEYYLKDLAEPTELCNPKYKKSFATHICRSQQLTILLCTLKGTHTVPEYQSMAEASLSGSQFQS